MRPSNQLAAMRWAAAAPEGEKAPDGPLKVYKDRMMDLRVKDAKFFETQLTKLEAEQREMLKEKRAAKKGDGKKDVGTEKALEVLTGWLKARVG